MKKTSAIICMFLDIGGVLFTNGWDYQARKQAATCDSFVLGFKRLPGLLPVSLEYSEVGVRIRVMQAVPNTMQNGTALLAAGECFW